MKLLESAPIKGLSVLFIFMSEIQENATNLDNKNTVRRNFSNSEMLGAIGNYKTIIWFKIHAIAMIHLIFQFMKVFKNQYVMNLFATIENSPVVNIVSVLKIFWTCIIPIKNCPNSYPNNAFERLGPWQLRLDQLQG